MWAVNWQLCKCNRWHDSLCWISITDLFVVNIRVISISLSLKWGFCSDQKRANFAVAKWNLIGEDLPIWLMISIRLNTKMKQDFLESHAHVLRVTADAICQQNFDSVANYFFSKRSLLFGGKCQDIRIN